MTNIKNSFLLLAVLLICIAGTVPLQAQISMTTTTLSVAVSDTNGAQNYVNVASATNVAAGGYLFVDKEVMQVLSTYTAGATRVPVRRGAGGRVATHPTTSTVYVVAPGTEARLGFRNYDLSGSCTSTAEYILPVINTANGNVWDCVSSLWQLTGGQAGSVFLTATQTLTNKTLTAPTLNTPTINAAIVPDTKKATTEFVAVTGSTGTTLTNVVGMSVTVVPGTYRFYINVPGVTTANAGVKYAFKYTTTVVGSIEAISRAFTASAVAVTHSTTATDQALLTDSAGGGAGPVVIDTIIEGTMVVTTGGTIQFQAAQKSAHADETKVYVGASMTFTRIS